VPSERLSTEEHSIEYCGWVRVVSSELDTTRPSTTSTSQKALRTRPEDGNVMPKHVGATIHN
jgi:hypothetical protein